MSKTFKNIINVSIWMLFIKAVLATLVTLYFLTKVFINGEDLPMVVVASCAVGCFAYILACVAVWIKQKVG
jgi:hypothetical protein